MANSDNAKARGDCDESAKLIEEKETEPEVTSGTPPSVLAAAEHVIEDWMEFTLSSTSAGSAVLPTTKHAFVALEGIDAGLVVSYWRLCRDSGVAISYQTTPIQRRRAKGHE